MGKISRHGGRSVRSAQVQVFDPPRTQLPAKHDPRRDAHVDVFAGEALPEVPAGERVDQVLEHPGTGQQGEPVEAPADGTETELATDDPPPRKRTGKRAQKRTSRPAGG